MDKFETQFEDLDVATGYYENATSSATAVGTPQDDVDKLMHMVADEAGVELGAEMKAHYSANRKSVAGYAGPCSCRWLVFDIDRENLAEALADARRLVSEIHDRYPELEGYVLIFFSGSKGFHVLLELAHNPPPAVGFHRVARTLAEALAGRAGAKIDTAIYDANHIIRLPNTRHPKTGLFKRRIDADALFSLSMSGILDLAKHPSGEEMPSVRGAVPQLEIDWHDAERETVRTAEARALVRCDFGTAESRAPRYLLELLRFGVDEGERHQTVFRCAAWLTEQGAPPSLVFALLTEPGRDVGLAPKDAERQILCGIEHVRRPAATPTLTDLEAQVRRAGLTWERIRDHFDTGGDYCPIAGTLADLTGPQRATVWAMATLPSEGGPA